MLGNGLRRIGAVTAALLGALLLLVGAGGLGSFVPAAAAAPSALIDVCNNQKADPSDCQGDKLHGSVTWDLVGGDLVFQLTGTGGWQWSQIYICIPGGTPTKSADCQGNSAGLLDPSAGAYAVTGVTNPVVEKTSVSFDCDDSITATVAASALAAFAGQPIPWTIHVNSCGETTDEAFGSTGPAAGAPASPATPGAPNTPGSSNTPAAPANPNTPAAPAAPDVPAAAPNPSPEAASVLGVELVREAPSPAPAAVAVDAAASQAVVAASPAAATLARTGPTWSLVVLGGALVLLGVLLVAGAPLAKRPEGAHYL